MSRGVARFTRKAEAGLRRMSRVSARVGAGLRKAGIAAAAMGAAAGAALLNIGRTGASFEQAITNVGAVSLKTRDQIKPLEDQAKSLGATTKFTATQVAAGMEIMARAGFETNEIMSGIPGVLDAAAASGLELAEVSNVVSNVLKGMGLEASEASNVADVLALASARTNSTIGTLGESMKNVASTARQLNIPLTDVVAGVASLQDVGLDASVAGSAMNTMLTKLAAPSKSLRKKFKDLGIAFEDTAGNALPFNEILANLSKGAKKSGGNMKQVAFLAELVGLRGQKAASNLSKLFETGKLERLTKELEKAGGSAKKMADIRMDTLTGDLLKLEAAADSVKIQLFDTESGPLRAMIQGMTKWIEKNDELIQSEFVSFLEKTRENMDGIVLVLKAIGAGVAVWLVMTIAIKAAAVALFIWKGLVALATAAVWLYNAALFAGKIAMFAFQVAAGIGLGVVVAGVLALTAVVLSLIAIWDQLNKLAAETEGLGITGTISEMFEQGTFSPFEAIDEFQNRKARERAGERQLETSVGRKKGEEVVGRVQAVAGAGAGAGTLGQQFDIGAANAKLGPSFDSLLASQEGVVGANAEFEKAMNLQQEMSAASAQQFDDTIAREGAAIAASNTRLQAFEGFLSGLTQSAIAAQGGDPQVVTPGEVTSRAITESTETQRSEVTIIDQSGRAQITKQPKGAGSLKLQQSGAL